MEDMEELAEIMAQADRLSYDINELQRQLAALFDLEHAPVLHLRVADAPARRFAGCGGSAWSYAMRLQTLGRTAQRTVQHLSMLLKSISAFLGNKQAQQSIAQMNATMSKTLAIQAAQRRHISRRGGFDKMEELMTIESLQRIQQEIMADWPRR